MKERRREERIGRRGRSGRGEKGGRKEENGQVERPSVHWSLLHGQTDTVGPG